MNFFRLRIINILLVMFTSFVLVLIIKDRLGRKEAGRYAGGYPRGYTAAGPAPDYSPAAPAAQDPAASVRERFALTGSGVVSSRENTEETEEDFALPVKPASERDYEVTYGDGGAAAPEEPSPASAAAVPPGSGTAQGRLAGTAEGKREDTVVRGAEDVFFKNPERYAGRDLAMELQMILARKTPNGWLLNFVHARDGKNTDYLYMEDDFLLGEKPELKAGYFYNVVFKCVKGNLSSGNNLLGIQPSGRKAAWAAGTSAIE